MASDRIENVMVIGAGIMGSGIALTCLMSNQFNSIQLCDVNQNSLDSAKSNMVKKFNWFKKKDATLDDKLFEKMTLTTVLRPITNHNLLVIEAVPEHLELKQSIFRQLSDQLKNNPNVILTTNTSSLKCSEIGKFVVHKSHFAGLHFSNPVEQMKLVEIVKTDSTDDRTLQLLKQFVQDINKVGVTCRDTQGFILNRLLIPYLASAVNMLERGDAIKEDIDTAMKLGAGHAMGPIELVDLIGLDTCKMIVDRYVDENGNRLLPLMPSLDKLIAEGHLGRKSGQGYYTYVASKSNSSRL